jgi:D-glycero-alpha-D-manno-heptose-7-phosphate kinase
MIITRSPLRITLGGGGTDLPSYYRQHGGFLIAAAIDKNVYVTVMRPFVEGIFLKYSKLEQVTSADEVQHPIIREAIRMLQFRTPQIEITTLADIPAGTGLGSSGSFSTALLKALYAHRRRLLHPDELAELACDIEINRLHEPVGKQDQHLGVRRHHLLHVQSRRYGARDAASDGHRRDVRVEDNLLLFFTGYARNAGAILSDQHGRTEQADGAMIENLHYVKELGHRSCAALERGDLSAFAALMHEHWLHKKQRSPGMSSTQIDDWYQLARDNGALGGKLVAPAAAASSCSTPRSIAGCGAR